MKEKKELSRQEREILFKGFFLRFKQGVFSSKENAVIDRILSKYRRNKKKIELTRGQVDEAEKRFRTFLQREIPELSTAQTTYKHRRRNVAFARYGSMVAAAVLLLIMLNLPVVRNIIRHNEALTAHTLVTDSFTTERNIKSFKLSDGTVVYLNVNTKLTLRKDKFTAQTREVWLDEGEAFFEVAKDASRPFIVHTADGLQTRVLGTSFNIKAYAELSKQVVSVATGKVQVSNTAGDTATLTPNRQVVYHDKDKTLHTGKALTEQNASWREGYIEFVNADYDEVAMRIAQYYGVKVVNKDNALKQNLEFYANYRHTIPLSELASSIATIYKVKYEVSGKTLVFSSER